ncbi:MAG: glutathione S-transferase N-terminal domain-containing protein [Polyangiaceae bacterium]
MPGLKLYRFPYSCYARYVQAAIELVHVPCEVIDVPYGNREELATLTGGSIQVPVLVRDGDARPIVDSRRILRTLVDEDPRFGSLVPAPLAGPIWAYADWISTTVEDLAFRLATPGIAERFRTAFETALFRFVKERKYGAGCVEAWARDADSLFAALTEALAPTVSTLSARPFLFGDAPNLADASLYGQIAMLEHGAPDYVAALPKPLLEWKTRFEGCLGAPPYGRIAAEHRGRADLDRLLEAGRAAERTSKLEKIVLRTSTHERSCPEAAELVPGSGLVGDRWAKTGGKPGAEVSIMDARVARCLAGEDDWALAGDNLFVDMPLDEASLRPGDRLSMGDVVLEITTEPHRGCRKFLARFGPESLRWLSGKGTAGEHRRGVYARVLVGGTLRVGMTISVVRPTPQSA